MAGQLTFCREMAGSPALSCFKIFCGSPPPAGLQAPSPSTQRFPGSGPPLFSAFGSPDCLVPMPSSRTLPASPSPLAFTSALLLLGPGGLGLSKFCLDFKALDILNKPPQVLLLTPLALYVQSAGSASVTASIRAFPAPRQPCVFLPPSWNYRCLETRPIAFAQNLCRSNMH